jgi:selenocysteine lyase/cysteine desulfurase
MTQTWQTLVDEDDSNVAKAGFMDYIPDAQRKALLSIEALRHQEFCTLDADAHTYLDYTGGSLSPQRLLNDYKAKLDGAILGNPHSRNPTSAEATKAMCEARQAVLEYFNVPRAAGSDPLDFEAYDYLCVFTANASAGLRLIGEAYPFTPRSVVAILRDNHNSAVAIRAYAKAKGGHVRYVDVTKPALHVDEAHLAHVLASYPDTIVDADKRLVILPAQSNFTGIRHNLGHVAAIQAQGWDVLLDAAAYAPTSRLDLARVRPAFTVAAFYKMFGFPTGVGVLLIRRDAVGKMQRPAFAGGSVEFVSSLVDHPVVMIPGHAGYEDGTINYLSLQGVTLGVRFLEQYIDAIHHNTQALTQWTIAQLKELRHTNGEPVVHFYGDTESPTHGATLAFNLTDPSPTADSTGYIPYQQVEADAAECMISLRAGRFCNHVVAEQAFGIPAEFMAAFVGADHPLTNKNLVAFAKGQAFPIGAVRVSFGLASTFQDAYRLVAFVKGYKV